MPRDVGAVNWIGLSTLIAKEIRRFLKVWVQTIASPVVTTLLFYSVFALALGGVVRMVGDVPFLTFLALVTIAKAGRYAVLAALTVQAAG